MVPRAVRGALVVLASAFAVFAAGCHAQNNISGYGLAWVTVSSEPGASSGNSLPTDFSSYIVTIDSITLTRNDGVVVTALANPEIVDFAQLTHNRELWGTATIPIGTYVSATVRLDYTSVANGGRSVIAAIVGGVPTPAKVVDTTGATPTAFTFAVTVAFDPSNLLVITPTYASTSAIPLAIDLDLGASGFVTTSGSTLQYVVNPFLTVGVLPSDTKLTRIRGPLINTNNAVATGGSVGTFSVYVRPFYDEVSNLGAFSLFSTASTIFTINGVPFTGDAGITALSELSAGSTMTAAYTTFVPDYNPANQAYAGTFYPVYVIAGSTLEDNYTQGLSGDVIARNGNTLTLRGSTFFYNEAQVFTYEILDASVLVGPGTLVSADDTTLGGLNYNSIGVGQHIEARGIYSQPSLTSPVQLDATGTSNTNTGSVRLISTQLYGSLISSAAGSLVMNLTTINDWPESNYTFTGNGTSAAADPSAAAFTVNTGSLSLPSDLVAGAPVWVDGLVTPFGSAPPDFTATAVNSETSVQVAGGSLTAAGTQSCGLGSQICEPASLRVLYDYSTGTSAPFATSSATGFTIDMTNAALNSAVIRIGPETINLKTLTSSPAVVPTSLAATSTFGPQYTIGNPNTSTLTATATIATPATTLHVYSDFPSFVTEYNSLVSSTNTVLQLTARGVYDRNTNTFTATDIDVVL